MAFGLFVSGIMETAKLNGTSNYPNKITRDENLKRVEMNSPL